MNDRDQSRSQPANRNDGKARWLWVNHCELHLDTRATPDLATKAAEAEIERRRRIRAWPFGIGNRVLRNGAGFTVTRGLAFNHPYAVVLSISVEPLPTGTSVTIQARLSAMNPIVEALWLAASLVVVVGAIVAAITSGGKASIASLGREFVFIAALAIPFLTVLTIIFSARLWVHSRATQFAGDLKKRLDPTVVKRM